MLNRKETAILVSRGSKKAESNDKANILNEQFKSVFTKENLNEKNAGNEH